VSTVIIVILIVVILALVAVGATLYLRRRRSEQLREQFGPEYEREVAGAPNRVAAEKDLQARQKRHNTLDIRPLERDERVGYRASWDKVQSEFVDSPGDAVREADRLVIAIMATRGYPTDDFDQRATDVSVEHPEVVEHYRRAHQIAVAHARGDAGTEDLRQAAISYRALVQALLDDTTQDDSRTQDDGTTQDDGRSQDDGTSPADDRSRETDRSQRPDRPAATGSANGDRPQQERATTTATGADRSDT
jgi:hypothetical protein